LKKKKFELIFQNSLAINCSYTSEKSSKSLGVIRNESIVLIFHGVSPFRIL